MVNAKKSRHTAKNAVCPYFIWPDAGWIRELIHHPACSYITFRIVAFALIDLDSATGAGVDELEVSAFVIGGNHNSHVTYGTSAARTGEEHQVSLAEIAAFNFLSLCGLSA